MIATFPSQRLACEDENGAWDVFELHFETQTLAFRPLSEGASDPFKVENNSLELTRIFQNIFIDPIVSARKKAEKRGRQEEREKERKRRFGVNAIISFFLSLFLSTSLRRLFFFSRSLLGQ